jgi:hypothetical protein
MLSSLSTVALVSPPAAQAASTDGELTVTVVRDMTGSGLWDTVVDPVMPGVAVAVTDAYGTVVNLTTDANGEATLPAGDTRLKGGRYRVNVTNPDTSYYQPAPADTATPAATPSATAFSSNTEFVDLTANANATVTTAFWHPHDYCQSNPKVANACQPGIYNHGTATADYSARPTLFTTNYTSPSYTSLADSVAGAKGVGTGSLYGVAYNRKTKLIYSGAYARRNVAYGDGGPGAIYVTDPATSQTSVFTTVPNVGLNGAPTASATAHEFGTEGSTEDESFIQAVGRESLGALVVSEDSTRLFAVNMGDKKVYVYDISNPAAPAGAPQTIDLSANPCGAGVPSTSWRPMGLGQDGTTLYVGGVCTGEDAASVIDPAPATMKAIVRTFNEATLAPLNGGAPILDQPINYVRAGDGYSCKIASGGGRWAGWFAWNDRMWCGSGSQNSAPQPMLGKIAVEVNGNLDLAFRDRSADIAGVNLPIGLEGGGQINPYLQAGGDLNLACPDGTGAYIIDSNGGCGMAPVPAGSPVNRFYSTSSIHPNATYAGMTMSRREVGLITDEMDGSGLINSQAINVKNRTTGANVTSQLIADASGLGTKFGKGQGLADMDVLCDLAPIQIGNRVFYNGSGDGKQNPTDDPVVGATVNLYDAHGVLVATTTTNENGEYSFSSLTTAGLTTNTDYVVKMDNPADYATGGPLDRSKYGLTKTLAGADDANQATLGTDSYPAIPLTTGDTGSVDHSYDFGFTPKPAIHIVKFDGRMAGPIGDPALVHNNNVASPVVYAAGANGMTGAQPVKMIVTNTGTAALGTVVVSDKTLGSPRMTGLSCDFSALGGPSTGTTWAGIFKPGDSFPCTGLVNLEAGQVHGDEARVDAVQVDPVTGIAAPGATKVADADRYYAKVGYQSKIVITKRDKKTGREADTKGTALVIRPKKARTIDMPATNVGTSPVTHVTIKDTTLRGAKMTNLRCTFPDGTKAKANSKGVVTWKASFGSSPRKWYPGVTFHCTGTVKLAPGGKLHGDSIKVTGIDPQGRQLLDRDRFYAKPLPAAPNTGA